MEEFSLFDKLKYKFDNLMSKGTASLVSWLGLVSLVLVLVMSFLVWITQESPDNSFLEILWMSFMRAIDGGTLSGDTGSFLFMLFMLIVTLGGIFIVSIFIGIITSGIQEKVESLRRGKSVIIEKDHIVILGWSDNIFTLIEEFIEANINQKKSCIAIMAPKDKVEMEEELKERISKKSTTKIVCRQGLPIDILDLKRVNINDSKVIIINDDVDSNTIKTILAITSASNKRSIPYNIVATIKDPQNLHVAQIAGRGQAEIILEDKLISRIIAQTCRQPGLSAIYTDLLDFDGDEIYFKAEKNLEGKQFGDILNMYEDSAIIGLKHNNTVMLKPAMDFVFEKDDEVIAISKDDDTIKLSGIGEYNINKNAIVNLNQSLSSIESTLLLGWNEHGKDIISELDNYVVQGSSITVAGDFNGEEEELGKYFDEKLKNMSAQIINADITSRDALEKLVSKKYDHIIILCYKDKMNIQEADAITLVTLLQLRDIGEKSGIKFSIVSEMLDVKNRNLAEIGKVNDFIISDKLISLMTSQISENKLLNRVFEDLFDADGSEIYIKNVTDYVKTEVEVNFYTLIEAAKLKNELAIGYKIASQSGDITNKYGIYLNPIKSKNITLTKDDRIIVLAE